MSADSQILDKLINSGVFLWDASEKRVFEISDNFRDFLGLRSNCVDARTLLQFLSQESIDSTYRKVSLGAKDWRSFFVIGGREYCVRFARLARYYDSDGVRHSAGTASVETDPPSLATVADQNAAKAPVSIFDDHSVESFRRPKDVRQADVYDLMAEMVKAFRAHFPPDVVVSVWMRVADEYLCVAVSGKILTAERQDVFRVGFRHRSKVVDEVIKTYGVQVFASMEPFTAISRMEVVAIHLSGLRCGAVSTVRSIDTGDPWGFVACVSSRVRDWSTDERQRIQLLSDSLSVFLAQSDAYSQVAHNLLLSQLACEAGGLYTWQWDVVAHKRSVLMADGTLADAPYELLAHHDDRASLLTAYASVECGRKSAFRLKARLRLAPGAAVKWYEVSARRVSSGPDGQASMIVGVARDIDEIVRAEYNKQKDIAKRNDIYNKMPAVIALCDPQGRQEYLNDRALVVFGIRTVEERLGVNIFDSPLISEEQKTAIKVNDSCSFDFIYDFRKVTQAGYYRTMRSDVVEMNVRSAKLYTGGVMTGFLFVFTDLSLVAVHKRRLKLFNGFFSEIGKFSKIGICQFGPGGFFSEQWNINLAVSGDVNPHRRMIESQAVCTADIEAINAALSSMYDHKITHYKRDARVRHADGEHIISLSFSYSEVVNAITAVSVDISDAHEKEEALVRALRKAEQVESMRSRFFNSISHELRTPLNSIVGFSDLIAQTQVHGDFARYAGIIRRSNAQLLNLVDGIMELSQLQTGNRYFTRQMVEVDSIVSDIHERMNGQQGVNVRFLAPHDQKMNGLKAPLDIVATSQIICKMVANAFHFTKSGCVMLWCSVEGGNIVFHVSDTGCGIPADKLESIFDVFEKVDVFGSGAGLGLTVCRELAHQLGGEVGVESAVGRGSHFWLSLPMFADEASTADKSATPRPNIVILPHNQDLTIAVSLLMPQCNVFSCSRNEFPKVWMDNRPRLSVIDVRECPDVAIHYVENVKAFGDDYVALVINTPDSGIAEADLLSAGAASVVMAPLTETSLAHAISRLVEGGLVRMPVADCKRIIS